MTSHVMICAQVMPSTGGLLHVMRLLGGELLLGRHSLLLLVTLQGHIRLSNPAWMPEMDCFKGGPSSQGLQQVVQLCKP